MKPPTPLIGRHRERAIFDDILASGDPAFIAVYGRRRVGKTYLIRKALEPQLIFELTGTKDAPLKEQLETFTSALSLASGGKFSTASKSWKAAFSQLAEWFATLPKNKKHVLFLDELPWLASPRSRFLPALDHFWNAWASKRPNLVLIVCGSAASWMIRKFIHDRGGLHNRITHRIRLDPFTLAETQEFLQHKKTALTPMGIAELYMALGGIPYYLTFVKRGESPAQTLDRICFEPGAPLRDEFNLLYPALFDSPERHINVVRALAKKSLTHHEVATAANLPSSGRLTTLISELEESGFIRSYLPFGKKKKDTLYRLSDEYSRFYLRWIERSRADSGSWQKMRTRPAWRAWSGLAFEELCMKHLPQIKAALGIAAVSTETSSWIHRPKNPSDTGTQIDLLIDRADSCINLCEMKFTEAPFIIDKKYATTLRARRETFLQHTGTKKSLINTFITTQGIKETPYALELADTTILLESLFKK